MQKPQFSKSELKRLFGAGAIEVNGKKLSSLSYLLKDGDVIKIGKKIFFKAVEDAKN